MLMKSIVIYFSQTGNTEKVAYAVQAGVDQVAGHCDIAKIKDANPKRLYEYDLIGIGSPLFEVTNVWQFMNKLRGVGGKHVFLFCTHGSAIQGGNFFHDAYRRLKPRGVTLIGTADWYGDCYLLHHTYPYPSKGHPDEIDLKEAEEFGRDMVLRSWKVAAGETALIPPEPVLQMPVLPPLPGGGSLPVMKLPPLIDGKDWRADVVNSEHWKTISSLPSMLKFHKEKCLYPKCRLCMENCPVDGIDLSVDPPVIAKPCEHCEFCGRVCPTGAIDIDDWIEAVAKITFPNFPAFDQAEAEGIFRRLTPKEELKADVYGYMVHTKHPYWTIGKGAE
jgi:flavodoxin/ferredoxin